MTRKVECERLTRPKKHEYHTRLQAAARPSRAGPGEAVLAGILPLIGITGDIAFDGAEAVVGPVIIATMLLPYLVAPPLVRQIRAEGERARGF